MTMENKENKVYYFRGNKQRGAEGIRELMKTDPEAANTYNNKGTDEKFIYYLDSNHDVDFTNDDTQLAYLLYRFGTEIQLPRPVEKGDIMVSNTEHSFAVVKDKPEGEKYFHPLFMIVDGNIQLKLTLNDSDWHYANNKEMQDFMKALKAIGEFVDNVCKPFNAMLTVDDNNKIKIGGEINGKKIS